MADEKPTPDQAAAEKIGRAIDGQIFRLNDEKTTLLKATERISDIDAEMAELLIEKTRVDAKRPPKPAREDLANVTR